MPFSGSIKGQIRALVVGVGLPLVMLAAFTIWADFRGGLSRAQDETAAMAATTAVAASQYLQTARLLASELVMMPAIRSLDPVQCEEALRPVSAAIPQVANLVVVRADASPVCSARPPQGDALPSAADRPWVLDVLATGEPTVSEPIEGRIIREPVVIASFPILGTRERIIGALIVSLGLDQLRSLVEIELPEGTLLTITDTTSIVVARSQDDDAWIGQRLPQPDDPTELADLSLTEGFNTTVDADGEPTLFAYHRVPDSPWVIWVGVPVRQIYAPARRALYPKLGLVALGLLFSWLVASTISGRIQASLAGIVEDMAGTQTDPLRRVDESGPEEVARVAAQYNRLLDDRRAAADTATRSQDLHQLLLRATQDAVWDWDLEQGTLEGNRRFFDLFGGRPGEGGDVDQYWRDRIHPEDVDSAIRVKRERPAEGVDVWSHEYRIRRDDGEWAVVLDRGRAMRDESGAAVRLLGSIMDVTEDRKSQQRIRRAKERYESIVRNATFGVYVASADGTLLEANPAMQRMLSPEGEGPSGPTAAVLNERDLFRDPEQWRAQLDAALAGAAPSPIEVEWVRPDGHQLQVRLFRSVFRDEDGVVTTEVIAEDLTERRELELQFRQAQKMEAMGRLAGGVAHDFNNRLTVIRGQAQLLREDLADDAPKLRGVDAIIASADRAAQLTRELLAVSRKQIFRPRILSLNDSVARMQPMFDTLLGKALSVESDMDPELPTVEADPGQIEQILMNLVVNARDAVADSGTITIRTRVRDVEPSESQVHPGLSAGRYVSLTVTDTGVGMSQQILERVFEPFFTTKPQGQGTGLGLATVYGLVKLNGGWIGLRSEPGEGTEVEVLLPPSVAEATPPDTAEREAPVAPAGAGARILVVEDEDAVRAIVSRTLERLGYDVLTADRAEAALDLDPATIRSLSLVVSDVVMPGMSGLDLADQLFQLRPELPVLFMSGYTERSANLVADLRDGRQFIAKPFTPNALGVKVAEILAAAS